MITEKELKIIELYPAVFPANFARELAVGEFKKSNLDEIFEKIHVMVMKGYTGFSINKDKVDVFCINILKQLGYDIGKCGDNILIEW